MPKDAGEAGRVAAFKKGAFYMAAQAGVPIVPVALKNTDHLMGKGTGEARAGTIDMVMLPPVSTGGSATDEEIRSLVNQVQSLIAKELESGQPIPNHGRAL